MAAHHAVVFVAVILLVVVSPTRLAASGTGEISGTVAAVATGRPIRSASVSLSVDDAQFRVAETDDQGRFQFAQLPAGRYRLAAKQLGFLDVRYGQTRPGSSSPGTAIHLAEGQRLQQVVLKMPRGGAISGVVLDFFGDPEFGASVSALRDVWTADGRTQTEVETVLSDDRGMYRIPLLPPGEYVVKASAPEATTGETGSLAPVYYPGVTSVAEADVVTLGLSEERSGINIALQRQPSFRVSGVVIDPDGRPPARPLAIVLGDSASGVIGANISTQVYDGKFVFPGLGPGRYTIRVLAGSGIQAITMDAATPMEDARSDGPALWAQAEVTVTNRDVPDVRLALQSGGTLSGRVAIVDGMRLSDLSQSRIRIQPIGSNSIWRPIPGAPIDANGAFTIGGIPPGRYRLSLEGAVAGLKLHAVFVSGRDVLDSPFDVEPQADITDVLLTMTDRTTELSGAVSDATGQPAPDSMVVAFAAESRYWTLPSRRIVAMRPASDGRYDFVDLPGGDYRVIALFDAEPGRWFDPRFLQELVHTSTLVHLDDGEQRAQDIRVKSGDP